MPTKMTPEQIDSLRQSLDESIQAVERGTEIAIAYPPPPTLAQRLKYSMYSFFALLQDPFFMMLFFFSIGASAALTEAYRTGGIVLLFCSTLLLAHFHYAMERKDRQRRMISALGEVAVMISQKFQPQGWLANQVTRMPKTDEDDANKIALQATKRRLAKHILSRLADALGDLLVKREKGGESEAILVRQQSFGLVERAFWKAANLIDFFPEEDNDLDLGTVTKTSDKSEYADSVIDFIYGLLADAGHVTTRQRVSALFLALQIARKLEYLPPLEQTEEWKAWKERNRKKAEGCEDCESYGGCEGCEGCGERVDALADFGVLRDLDALDRAVSSRS